MVEITANLLAVRDADGGAHGARGDRGSGEPCGCAGPGDPSREGDGDAERIEEVEGVDHFFSGKLDDLRARVGNWARASLGGQA